jgi:two-component system sensor histidine kinase AgrC
MGVFNMKFIQNMHTKFLNYRDFQINCIKNMNTKSKIFYITNLVLGVTIVLLQFSIMAFAEHISPFFTIFISIITIIIYILTTIYIMHSSCKFQDITQNLEESNFYNNSLITLHDDVRAFKHDFSNILQAFGGYITNNDMTGLKVYYSQLFSDCEHLNNLYTLSPKVINNPAIYNLLSSKYYKANDLGITIHLNVFLDLNNLNMKIYEFTRIFGILMDNAIEATTECNEKIINIEIRNDSKHNRQLLIIENTYADKNINVDNIFKKGYSSKPNNTGLGLWEVQQILKKNKNLNLYTTYDEHFFKQQLELYYDI